MPRVTSVVTPVAHLVGPGRLHVMNDQIAFHPAEGEAVRIDPRGLRAIFCYGPVGITDRAVDLLLGHDVETAWLSLSGDRCRGRLAAADAPRAPVRFRQHRRFADGTWAQEFAARIVRARIDSQGHAVRHYQRHGGPPAGQLLRRLREFSASCGGAAPDTLRGLEGTATAAWFAYFARLLRPPWAFPGRARRPPPDPVNALLSLGYTLLLARVVARCEAAGLEVALGALHVYRAGRPSLACDLMEPLRVPAVDRWVVVMCNEGRVAPGDFTAEGGGVRLRQAAFPRTIQAWEEFWLSGPHERRLDQWVEGLLTDLRSGSDSVEGSPPEEAARRGEARDESAC